MRGIHYVVFENTVKNRKKVEFFFFEFGKKGRGSNNFSLLFCFVANTIEELLCLFLYCTYNVLYHGPGLKCPSD